jgi:phosphatidylglycerol:prolipoprotein diacylglycerol transferase
MSSKALDIGSGIYWYGILIALGLILAVCFAMTQRYKYGITEDNILDTVLWGIPFGIIGARLYYVIFYLDSFRNSEGKLDFGQVIAIWDGGLAIYGAVIAVVLVALVMSKISKFNLWALMDLVVMGLLIGQSVGRWGNFMNREAFGSETTLPWRMQLTLRTGEIVQVHPTFFYESLWNVIGLLLIVFVVSRARRFDGENTCFYFLWYGIGRFFIEGLRTDSLYLFDWQIMGQPIRVSQALSLVMIVVSLVLLFVNGNKKERKPLFVDVVAAAELAAAEADAAEVEEVSAEDVVAEEETVKEEVGE